MRCANVSKSNLKIASIFAKLDITNTSCVRFPLIKNFQKASRTIKKVKNILKILKGFYDGDRILTMVTKFTRDQ